MKVQLSCKADATREVYAKAENVLALTKKLCSIPSVSAQGDGENRVAQFLLETLQGIKPAEGNTLCVKEMLCEGDALGRKAVWALLRAAKKTAKTVLLTGHFDVVDTQGKYSSLAFSPDSYTKALAGESLPEEVAKDLASGNWLFGRGTMDMKAGLALFIETIRAFAKREDLAINIAFLAVPDEESDSAGMRGTIAEFAQILSAENLDVLAALTGEPCFWTAGNHPTRPYYTGTTGKIMPYFLCIGRATHVNDYAEGANAMLLASHVVSLFEGNAAFIDGEKEDTLSPPACLRCETRTGVYSVSLPARAVCFFNVLTDSRTPETVLEESLEVARNALQLSITQMQKTREALQQKGANVPEGKITGSVYRYRDLVEKCVEKMGSKEAFLEEQSLFYKTLDGVTDAREKAIRVSEWVADQSGLEGPAIVVGFLPPYYPHRVNRRRNEKERTLRRIIEEMVAKATVLSEDGAVSIKEVFGGITDLSFLGFEGRREALEALSENMPAWGKVYSLPLDQILKLDIPVANMGPAGRDAHKMTERLELKYSLEIAPRLLAETITKLANS